MLELGFFDLIRDLDAGVQAIEPGQVRRVEAADAGKGGQGKVVAFHILIDIAVDAPDDGLGAVGLVLLPPMAGIGAHGGEFLQNILLGGIIAVQIVVKERNAGGIPGGVLFRQFLENVPPGVQQQGKEQQQLFAVQRGRSGGIKESGMHHGLHSVGTARADQLIQRLEQGRELELALDHGLLRPQQGGVGILVRDQQTASALIHHAVDPV